MKKASHTDLTEKLGQKIRIERMKRKMSQEKLAELAELNRNFIGMVERGESNITVKNLENISKAFNMEIKELFNFVL
ncbi:helix-turn-helix transcriptional regulator [bacterium]|uniref:Helix-turn-helix transcriptional regulator n=1 Tax=Candidatus Scatenecus faecavium TaxID=2840915 RepID=A0A9D1K3A1_9BACT|nr:helix-turn-helix transcriptional regulator [bacterium]HIS82522.1 helix-turn-helix transcriptional regulator [Candidatus Scatenecus faecavium]